MLDIILDMLGVLFLTASGIYIWSSLLEKKINLKDYKFYIFTIILFILSIINYNNLLKFTFMTIFMSFFIRAIFKVNIKEGIVTATYTQVLNLLAELIFSIVALFILKINFEVEDISKWLVLFADIFVSISAILLAKIKPIRNLHNVLVKIVSGLNTEQILLCILPLIFIFNIYLDINYYKMDLLYVFILNYLTIYVIVIIIIILAKKEKEYTKIYDKYNTTLNSLKEYEEILDNYRVSNHENKNQLLTVRSMISTKNKKAIDYIDEIVQNRIKDDEKTMHEVSIIPAGGLRGLIYSKILYMKQNKIEYELNISKDVRTVDLIKNLDDHDILDICQVIGVYIDNAIDAVTDLKNKYVDIAMYIEYNDLIFEISNYYKGRIEIEKIEDKGYTTKGSGHGYGLSLTKEIIDKNKKLDNEKRLSKEVFTQILKIKM